MEQRWIGLLNELLYSASGASKSPVHKKPETEGEEAQQPLEPVTEKPLSRDTIIHIQDYREIQSSREGSRVITLLQKVIQERRRAGSRVLLIGSTSQ
jgi:aspartate-semialdehyde dehydrogenase